MNVNTEPRNGYVFLKEYMQMAGAISAISVYGKITICPSKETLGFEPHERESNWFAYVQGEKDQVAILGCQIRGFHFTEQLPSHPNTFFVS